MDTAAARQMFRDKIKAHLAPVLRSKGFKGGGSNFLRVSGETICAINIQGSRHGGSAAVNLGLHFTFLPAGWQAEPQPAEQLKEIDCDLRVRLSPKAGYDYWWEYGSGSEDAEASATNIADTFVAVGEPLFQRFGTPLLVAEAIPLDALRGGRPNSVPWNTTRPRLALTMARIHRHLGNSELSAAFAMYGLDNIGAAELLKKPLEALAHAS